VRAYDVHTASCAGPSIRSRHCPTPPAPARQTPEASSPPNPKLGLVFHPHQQPQSRLLRRPAAGDDGYANSVVAIDATSGKVVWHFQVVHHDLWDYDVASQPTLVTVKGTPAVAVTTKIDICFSSTGEPASRSSGRGARRAQSDVPEETAGPPSRFQRIRR